MTPTKHWALWHLAETFSAPFIGSDEFGLTACRIILDPGYHKRIIEELVDLEDTVPDDFSVSSLYGDWLVSQNSDGVIEVQEYNSATWQSIEIAYTEWSESNEQAV